MAGSPDQTDPTNQAGLNDPTDPTRSTDLTQALLTCLSRNPPFDALPDRTAEEMARAAQIRTFGPGDLVLDAFAGPTGEVFVVMAGRVDVWNDADLVGEAADERLGPGSVFGFSAMLTERSVGPRVVAADRVTVAAIPASAVEPAFASRHGARFLAEQAALSHRRPGPPSYSLVEDLIAGEPLVVDPADPVSDVARLMTERHGSCAVVPLAEGRYGLITDAVLRERVLVEGRPGSTPAGEIVDSDVPVAQLGDSAAEAQILMLDRDAEFLLVADRRGTLRGVITPRQFAVSPVTAGVSVHEQVRRAATVEELQRRARRVPPMLSDLLSRGLASGKVIAVYSAIVDTIVRRALVLTFAEHPELSLDAFTWLSLGSNGRREAVPSSDIDSAVAFDDGLPAAEIARYRPVLGQVDAVLAAAGLLSDSHGATASKLAFSRTNTDWRAAAREWMAAPGTNKGAVMASLLVDARPIYGDPGLPAAARVFAELRRHPGTMRLLLQESLSTRAKLRSIRETLTRRDSVDLKRHALLPVVNIARWAALSVGSAALPTTERLAAAAGSAMLPQEQAGTLIEVFEVLQRLRLRYQLIQYQRGERPSDVVTRERMSPIDRSVVAQAVREVAAVQRRMDNVAAYLPPEAWVSPAPS